MNIYWPLRAGLLVYECVRLAFLAAAVLLARSAAGAAFPWMVYAAPGALFPLMCLFWLLDGRRYGVYGPLYAAGKCVAVSTALVWYVLYGRGTAQAAVDWLSGTAAPLALALLMAGDVLSVLAALLVIKKPLRPEQSGEREGDA